MSEYTSAEAARKLGAIVNHEYAGEAIMYDCYLATVSFSDIRAILAERDALKAELKEMTAVKDIHQQKRFAHFEECERLKAQLAEAHNAALDLVINELIEAAPRFGPDGPRSSEEYGESEGFRISVATIRALKSKE